MLTNSTVSGNSTLTYAWDASGYFDRHSDTPAGGAGIHAYGAITLTNSTVTRNSAAGNFEYSGGGIFSRGGALTLTNSIIAGNIGGAAPDLYRYDLQDPAPLEVSHCLIGDSGGARLDEAKVNLNNLIDIDPLLGPLADNGGPTQTHALRPGSPAIDRGNATGSDQRGLPRVDNPTLTNPDGGTGSDIGAYERRVAFVVSDPRDVTDGDFAPGKLSLREAIALAEADATVDEIGFSEALSGQTLLLDQGELVIHAELRIDASNLPQGLIIDAGQKSRAIHFVAPAGNLELVQLTLRGGKTDGSNEPGGGILFSSAGQLRITRSTLSGNSTTGTDSHGGGMAAGTAPVTLTSSTLSANSSEGAGGGIHGGSGALILRNSLVAGNTDNGTAPDLAAPDDPANSLEVSHSLIGNSTGAGLGEAKINQNNLTDLDPLLEQLADNGGPTRTHALADASPAIDRGNTTEVDQRGYPRINSPDAPDAEGSNSSDIGAFEWVPEVFIVSKIDCPESELDFEWSYDEWVSCCWDIVDPPLLAPGDLSLRQAIILANAIPGPNEIRFSDALSGAVISLYEELVISDDLRIDASDLAEAPIIQIPTREWFSGPRGRLVRFAASSGDLSLTNLTLRNGWARGHGGGIRFESRGALTLTNCTVSGNRAEGLGCSPLSEGAAWQFQDGFGGGIYALRGTLTLTNSTISGNSGLGIEAGGALTISNSTIIGNIARWGGGIHMWAGALVLTNSVIAGNSGDEGVRDIAFDQRNGEYPSLEVTHCLIGDSTGARLDEARVNLNNLIGIDPLLGPLADNGGPTWTMLPLPGSPLIDAGGRPALADDQRGFARSGAAPDIGAAEYQGPGNMNEVFAIDYDRDGNPYGLEQALGTDPFRADPADPRNLIAPTFDSEGQPTLSFGIAEDAAPGTIWILERSSDLRTFDEIYRFDGTTHLSVNGLPIEIATTATGVLITDQAPPAGKAFYRLRIAIVAPEG